MDAIALKPIRVRSTGQEYLPGDRVDAEPEKLFRWSEQGLVRLVASPGEMVRWNSPIFGKLSAPVLEMKEKTFVLRHPLTDEIVELSREWLASLEERAAIIEFDDSKPREEADAQARREFFGLFRKGRA